MRTELIDEIADAVGIDDIVFEAPTKASQAWFVKQPRPDGEPRQHPARRGDPARDAPARAPRRHAEGGAARWRARPLCLISTSRPCPRRRSSAGRTAEFGDRMCLTCSWQRQSSVLVHMVSELGLDDPRGRARHARALPGDVRDARPPRRALRPRAAAPCGPSTRRDRPVGDATPTRCCRIRKVEAARATRCAATTPGSPASAASSRRRAPNAQKVEWSERYGVWKIQPLVDWDAKRVDAYILVNEIPVNPLHEQGYPSIGCIPCTRPVAPRRGRARRALGGLVEARVRHPRRRAARERDPCLAASWSGSRASPAPGSRRSPSSSAASSRPTAASSSTSTATSCASTSRRASASRRRTATRTSSGSAGSRRGSPATARPCSCRRSRRTRRRARGRGRWSRSSRRSSRCTSRPRSRSARAATSRASTRRRSAASSPSSPASPTRTRSRSRRSCGSRPRAARRRSPRARCSRARPASQEVRA